MGNLNADAQSGEREAARARSNERAWACPVCRVPLVEVDSALHCTQCVQDYPIRHGIPLLMADPGSYGEEIDHFDERVLSQGDDPSFYLTDLPRVLNSVIRWNTALRMRAYSLALRSVTGRILDIGCATGAASAPLASDPENRVYGIDLSVEALRIARGKGLIAAQASASELPFPDGFFDAVLCLSVLPYFRDPGSLLQEIQRTLKPNGRLFLSSVTHDSIRRLTSPVVRWILKRRGQRLQIVRRDRLEDVLSLLTESGMDVVRLHTVHFPLPFIQSTARPRWWHRLLLSEVLLEADLADGSMEGIDGS